MPQFTFRTFGLDGEARSTIRPTLDLLRSQEHLIPLLDAISHAMVGQTACCKLVLSIEDADPFEVEWAAVGERVGFAHVNRAGTKAILVTVFDTDGSVNAAAMRSLQAELTLVHGAPSLEAAFDWLIAHAPPVAALAYLNGEMGVGLDTVAMCLAATFFSNCEHGLSR